MDQACGTCLYFRLDAQGTPERRLPRGVCAHPDHRGRGVAILIAPQETRCRRGFGEDDWTPRPSLDGAALSPRLGRSGDDILIDERPAPLHRPRRGFPVLVPLHVYADREEAVAD